MTARERCPALNGPQPWPLRPATSSKTATPDIIYATAAVIPKKSSRAAATKMER
jgi:hypothetical protein